MLKYLHEFSFSWDGIFTVSQFDPTSPLRIGGLRGINFYFKVVLPKARKEREIIERDYLGRIIKSKVPFITL